MKLFKKFKLKNIKIFLIFITILVGLLISLFLKLEINPFYFLALRFSDVNYQFHKTTIDNNITLILVDEKSINKFGRWPWDRRIFAQGLKNLSDAKVIALDIVFSENTTKESDLYLADTISKLGNVICGVFTRKHATQNPSEDILDILSDSALYRIPKKIIFPEAKYLESNILPITESCFLSATFNAIPDKDGLFRRYLLGFIFEGMALPSLGLQVVRAYLEKDIIMENNKIKIGNYTIYPNKDGTVNLNYYSRDEYKKVSYSFLDLYENKIPKEKIKNKIVILGISEAGVTDIRSTPIGLVPGPYLHVTFVSNFFKHELLRISKAITYIFIFIFALFTFLIYLKFEPGKRISLYIFLIVINFILARLLYLYKKTIIFDFYSIFEVALLALIYETVDAFLKYKQSKFYKDIFSTYVSPQLLEEIVKDPEKLKLGGEKRDITVLFSDVRGFTSLSEKVSPEKLVRVLNTYLTPMTNIILENKGTLDKYIGDAIMAIWNAPLDVKNHRELAVTSAYLMLKKLKEINEIIKSYDFPEIKIGIGINSGEAVVGNMGSEKRFEYTAIGDTVNLASRLEGLNKVYMKNNSGVLISEYTAKPLLNKNFPFKFLELDTVKVKGKNIPIKIYTILEKTLDNERIIKLYSQALKFYKSGNFTQALSIFKKIKNFPPADEMIERCSYYIKNPPQNWDGIFVAKSK